MLCSTSGGGRRVLFREKAASFLCLVELMEAAAATMDEEEGGGASSSPFPLPSSFRSKKLSTQPNWRLFLLEVEAVEEEEGRRRRGKITCDEK